MIGSSDLGVGGVRRLGLEAELELVAGVPWVRGDLHDEIKDLRSKVLNVLNALGLELWGKEGADALGENEGLVLLLGIGQEGVEALATVLAHAAGAVHGVAPVAKGAASSAGLQELLGPLEDRGKELWGDLLAEKPCDEPGVATEDEARRRRSGPTTMLGAGDGGGDDEKRT